MTTSPDLPGTPRTVLVTGATGKVGRHLVRHLLDDGVAVRALTRTPLLAGLPAEVTVVRGHPGDRASLAEAAAGADAAFLVWMGGDAIGADDAAAALARHVDHVVHLSAAELQGDLEGPKSGVWADVEAAVRRSGASWTFLRAGGFAANTLGWAEAVRAGAPVALPFPDAVRTSVHERDLAEVAWRCLVDPVHRGHAYDLTGPARLTQRQELEAIAAAVGTSVEVRAQTREEAVAGLAADWGPEAAGVIDYWASLVRSPERVADGVQRVTGHRARPFAAWAAEHVDDFTAHPTAEVEVRGLAAITARAEATTADVELVGVEVADPLVGEDRFGIRLAFDERVVATGERRRTVKLSLCHVTHGRIGREEVFYYLAPSPVPA